VLVGVGDGLQLDEQPHAGLQVDRELDAVVQPVTSAR
jgi:hypothetical protein